MSRRCGCTRSRRPERSSTPSPTGRTCSSATLGKRMLYAADEYYLMADRPFPDAERYDGFPMHEDGIGMARTFEAEFHGAGSPSRPVCSGASSPPSTPHRTPPPTPPSTQVVARVRHRATTRRDDGHASSLLAAPVRTDRACSPASSGRASSVRSSSRSTAPTSVCSPVVNDFFGGNTGVTGLMTGEDVAPARRPARGPSLPAARRVPVRRGPVPRRDHRRRTPAHRRESCRPTASRSAMP